MENSRKQNNYELGAVPAEKRRPFDDLAFNDSSASVLNTNIKRKDSATESDTQDDDFEVKTPLVAVHPVNESTSSAGNSRMSLGFNNEGEEYDIEPNKLGSSHQEYRLYKRRWIGVIALVSTFQAVFLHTFSPKSVRYFSISSKAATGSGSDRFPIRSSGNFTSPWDKLQCSAISRI